MKISIIVAIYNSELTLERCLYSLIEQTFKNIEIICINDGSIDSSINIIESFSKLDKRVIYKTTKNNGASSARNSALELVTGQYICIVDSDDYLGRHSINSAVEKLKSYKYDAVIFNTYFIKNNKKVKSIIGPDFHITGKEAVIKSLDWSISGLGLWSTKIIKEIKFDTSSVYGDELTTRYFFSKCAIIDFCDGVYYYCFNENSVTNTTPLISLNRQITDIKIQELLNTIHIETKYKRRYDLFRRKQFILVSFSYIKALLKSRINGNSNSNIINLAKSFSLKHEYVKFNSFKNILVYFLSKSISSLLILILGSNE